MNNYKELNQLNNNLYLVVSIRARRILPIQLCYKIEDMIEEETEITNTQNVVEEALDSTWIEEWQ